MVSLLTILHTLGLCLLILLHPSFLIDAKEVEVDVFNVTVSTRSNETTTDFSQAAARISKSRRRRKRISVSRHSTSQTIRWKDVCTQNDTKTLPFCNHSLNLEERVLDYVGRVPIEQQIAMMGNKAASYLPLFIPSYQWWSEGLHGPLQPCLQRRNAASMNNGKDDENNDQDHRSKTCYCPTSFPCPSGLGTSFNKTLFYLIGQTIGVEGRAIYNLKQKQRDRNDPNLNVIGDGLTYWSPTINLQRDPRWGRNQEVPGEDPTLTSHYTVEYVRGLQQDNASPNGRHHSQVKIAAGCKHFVANSLEQWQNHSRYSFNAIITKADLYNYYFPPFKACVTPSSDENRSSFPAIGVMCSYNAVNGLPSCMNEWLLKDVLRNEWKFNGYIVSDCGALDCFVHGHHTAIDATQASAFALNASVDVNCGNGDYYPKGLLQAYKEGYVEPKTIQSSFQRLVRVQMELGLFDNNFNRMENVTSNISDWDVIDSPKHQQLAYEAALQSIVLLQNNNRTLPLNRIHVKSVAVIGPHLHAQEVLLSNYHGERCCCHGSSPKREKKNPSCKYSCLETPLEAITNGNPMANTTGIVGCHVAGSSLNEIDDAVALSKVSDVVILLVGLDQTQEREEKDRYETTLPGLQIKLVQSILDATENTNTSVVLVLFNGGSMSLGQDILARMPAIVDVFYGGQAGSKALASILYGDASPTGKLAATMYPPSYVHEMPMTEMGVTVGLGRTHLYYKGKPEFPFGHGLSYSNWNLEMMSLPTTKNDTNITYQGWTLEVDHSAGSGSNVQAKSSITVSVRVQNIGPFSSAQTVLLFCIPPPIRSTGQRSTNGIHKTTGNIRQKLLDFQGSTRVLNVGDSEVMNFTISVDDLAVWVDNNDGGVSRSITLGQYELEARASNGVTARRGLNVVASQMSKQQ